MFRQKYLKYKEKNYNIVSSMSGGYINKNDVLEYIISIGFEFETGSYTKLNIDPLSNTLSKNPILANNEIYKIIISSQNNVEFAVVEDWANLKINDMINAHNKYDKDLLRLKQNQLVHYTQSGIVTDVLRTSINYKIIPSYDRVYAFPTTEFHVTFTQIVPDKNCIVNKFKIACEVISNYMNSCDIYNALLEIKYKESYRQLLGGKIQHIFHDVNSNLIYIPIRQEINPDGKFYDGRIIPNELLTIKNSYYMIQTTICVHYENLLHVLNYLLYDEEISSINKQYNKFISAYELSLKITEMLTTLFNIEYLLNRYVTWLTLIIFKYYSFLDYTKAISEKDDTTNIYLKNYMGFVIRHNMKELSPFDSDVVDMYDGTTDNIYGVIQQTIYQLCDDTGLIKYFLNLQNGNENINDNPIDNYTTLFIFNRIDQVVCTEIRTFPKQIRKFLGIDPTKNVSHRIIEDIANIDDDTWNKST